MPNGLWAMAKIESYGLQTEPFLHIDGDVFIFDYLPQELLTCGILHKIRNTQQNIIWIVGKRFLLSFNIYHNL